LRLSGVRLTRGDRLIDDVARIITENVRLPQLTLGDINAELAAVRIAETRLTEAVAKYGLLPIQQTCGWILRSSEARARAVVAALPDGDYFADDIVDGDGATDAAIAVCVVVRIRGDAMDVDFTGSSPARAAPINCSRGALTSSVKTVFKALVGPREPSNEGWFRPLTVTAPAGTMFTAEKPSPTGWYYEGASQAAELVWKALAPLAPDKFTAGSYVSLCGTYIAAETEAGTFVHIEPQNGGWGAGETADGASGLIAITDGDTYNYSVELLEAKFPLLVARYGYNTEGGAGPGRQRGGFGLVREYAVECDGAILYGSFGRNTTRPWGMAGGGAGSVNFIEVARGGECVRLTRPPRFLLQRGDRVRIITGGGGGWGDPLSRDPAAVADDVRGELLSSSQAAEQYGVVVDAMLSVDDAATRKRRND
jgi:N-methylhydantoinase B